MTSELCIRTMRRTDPINMMPYVLLKILSISSIIRFPNIHSMFSANLSLEELQRRDLEEQVNKPTNAPPLYSESLAQLQVRHLYRNRILFPSQINLALIYYNSVNTDVYVTLLQYNLFKVQINYFEAPTPLPFSFWSIM